MTVELSYTKIYHSYLGVFMAVFFFAPKFSALMIVLGIVLVSIGIAKGQLKFYKFTSFLFPILLYLAYLIGIVFTNHPDIARGYAENKLSFLVLPLIFSFRPVFNFRLGPVLVGAALGIMLAILIGVIHAYQCYSSAGTAEYCFTSVEISPIHHPSYFASFLIIIVFGCWWTMKKGEPLMDIRWILPFTLFSAVYFTLCLSLASFLILIIFCVVVILNWVKNRMNRFLFWALTGISPILIVIILIATPFFRSDVLLTVHTVSNYLKDPVNYVISKPGDKTGNEVRLVMWTVTFLEIADHPLGVGTGNVDDHLSQRLTSYGQHVLAQKDEKNSIRYNPHNQFLQTGLETGIAGFLLLALFLTTSLIIAYRYKEPLFKIILYSLIINCIFESMFQRQSGLIFYLFWICLMTVYVHQSNTQFNTKK